MERLSQKTIWAIFANLSLPDSQGLDTIEKLSQAAPGVPILVMGGGTEGEDFSLGIEDTASTTKGPCAPKSQ
jgi:DNA-binding response OmpR family regulator